MSLLSQGVRTIRRDGFDRAVFLTIRHISYTIGYHDRVSNIPPQVATPAFKLTAGLIRLVIHLLHKRYPTKYTDADPFKYIYVDPESIEYTTGEIFSKRRGWVVSGEWDQKGAPYMDRTFAKAIQQHFVEGDNWNETVLTERYDGPEFEKRTEKIDDLYNRIQDEGYKSQRQLLAENPDIAWSALNDAMHPLANEIAVDIGRNGELLWNICGQHRLAIAKILDVDRIPVQIFRRHSEWQKIREDASRGNELPEQLENHPDLQDILDG